MDISKPLFVNGHRIKNIIFDWGGVIVNIDFRKSVDAFIKLGFPDLTQSYAQLNHSELFDLLELGIIGPEDFHIELCKIVPGLNLSAEQFDQAWSALLLDTPLERIQLMQRLSRKYNLFLLSNTNKIHFDYMKNRYLAELGFDFLDQVFNKLYLSHEMHLQKPAAEIFNRVLEDSRLIPEETLFIDDTEKHVLSAQQLGIVAYHLKLPKTINEAFTEWLI
jgi:glucose-1-phosphatase